MGYFDEPELTARALDEEGWYYSGDLCRMDEAGLYMKPDKKDIVRGGENISSREVEDIYCSILKFTMPVWLQCPMNVYVDESCAYIGVLKAPRRIHFYRWKRW